MVHRSLHALGICLTAAVIAAPASAFAQQQPAASTALSQQAPVSAPASIPVRPPVLNRANELLPSWLRLRGEFRERMEGFDGLGFVSSRDDLYWLTRLRLNAAVTPSKNLNFQVQAHDARVARKTVGPTGAPFTATMDLRMGFAEVGSATIREC